MLVLTETAQQSVDRRERRNVWMNAFEFFLTIGLDDCESEAGSEAVQCYSELVATFNDEDDSLLTEYVIKQS